jgi:D-serine deaminase-like pyridoxal phosphate-dependent protein
LQQISQLSGYPVYVYIHVDFGDEVCGVRPGSQEFQDLFSQMEQIILQEGPISLVLPGFYCHMEDSEIVFDPLEVLRPLNKQLSGLLNASPVQNVRFSVNATAAISHVSKLLADEVEEERPVWVEALRETLAAISEAEHLIEVHDGAYPLMDLNALARSQALGLGKATSRDLDDVALTILTEVCCIYTKREQVDFLPEEGIRGEALISLGSETLGQEPSKLLYLGYGLVGQWNIAPELRDNLDNFSSFQVSRVAPECGVLVWDGPEDYVQPLRSGQRLRVYPNDATKASESFGWYVVIDSSRAGREDEVVDIFVRWKG